MKYYFEKSKKDVWRLLLENTGSYKNKWYNPIEGVKDYLNINHRGFYLKTKSEDKFILFYKYYKNGLARPMITFDGKIEEERKGTSIVGKFSFKAELRLTFLRFFIPVLVILGISVLLNNLDLKIGLIFGGIALLVILPGFYIYAYINRKYYNKYKDIYNELNKLFLTKMSGVVADDKDVGGS